MDTTEYYKRKERINSIEELTDREKEILIMELRTEYYGMDRSGLNHLNTDNLKPAIISFKLNN